MGGALFGYTMSYMSTLHGLEVDASYCQPLSASMSTLNGISVEVDASSCLPLPSSISSCSVYGSCCLSSTCNSSVPTCYSLSGSVGYSTMSTCGALTGPVGQSTVSTSYPLSGSTGSTGPQTSSIAGWSTITGSTLLRMDAENALKGLRYATKFKDVLEYSDTETSRLLVQHLQDWFQAEYNSTGAHDTAECLKVFTEFHREYSGGFDKSLRIFTRKNLWLKLLELKLYESRVFQRAMEFVVWTSA